MLKDLEYTSKSVPETFRIYTLLKVTGLKVERREKDLTVHFYRRRVDEILLNK
jgi:hypothetical protein